MIAPGQDIKRLESQNVDVLAAATTIQIQLRDVQQKAEQERKEQNRAQLVTTVVGALLGASTGWVISVIAPPDRAFARLDRFISSKRRRRQSQD